MKRPVGSIVAILVLVGGLVVHSSTAGERRGRVRLSKPQPSAQQSHDPAFQLPSPALPPLSSSSARGDDDVFGESADLPAPEAEPALDESLTPELSELRAKVRRAIALYQPKHLNTRDHSPWEVMHAFVAFNVATQLRRDGPGGPAVNAIGWVLHGHRCKGQQLVTLRGGRPYVEQGVGVQGHAGQLLAILAQSRVSAETPIEIDGRSFTLQDLIDEEMLDCKPNSELTFKLIGLTHYLGTDATWTSREGQDWSIPRLLQEELKAPIRGAACGGTHRLFGISYAYLTRQAENQPLDGEFLRAQQYIEQYHRYTRTLQNPDGSFSTEWFTRRGNRPDVERKIQTTGHILEWLILSLPEEQIAQPWSIKSIDFIATALLKEPKRAWPVGPLGHALHALVMYDQRVFRGLELGPPALAKQFSGAETVDGPALLLAP